MAGHEATRGTIVVVNPSPDVYGADLQMLQTVTGLVEHGWRVPVVLPHDGPLSGRIRAAGGEVVLLPFPVLRKANLRPRALVVMLGEALLTLLRGVRLLRRLRPAVLVVNTVTLPWWLLVGRLTGTPTIGHLHEAESGGSRLVRTLLIAPLRLADAVILISEAVRTAMVAAQPRLAGRARLVYNGVPGPPDPPTDAEPHDPVRLAVAGRLSPRKAPHVALEAAARLRRDGLPVTLEVAGTAFAGYEWYEAELRERAARPDLAGAVTFSGYCSPIWPVLQRADVVLAPSTQEPFGNVVVEAQLARRPVVAAAAYGHLESVTDAETGLLVSPEDPAAMAAAVRRLVEDPDLARRLAGRAEQEAVRRFSVQRYRREVAGLVAELAA